MEGRRKQGGPPSKAKYLQRPIADEYREGTVKSTPVRGVKETLKPPTYKQSEGGGAARLLPEGVPIEE